MAVKDDIGEYVDWKSLIKRTEVPGTEEKEKKERKNLAFANILIKGAGIKKVKAKAKFKIPISKEIEIINKWKDLDKADRELASARKHYKEVVKTLMNRWKEVENSQLFLKQNLVRYNNFVREKQAKVADGISFILMERQKQTKLNKTCILLESERDEVIEAKQFILNLVKTKVNFKDYLHSVHKFNPMEYSSVDEVMKRSQALFETKSKLKDKFDTTDKIQDDEDESLVIFKEEKLKQMLEYNVNLMSLQKISDENEAKIQMNKRSKTNIDERISEKRSQSVCLPGESKKKRRERLKYAENNFEAQLMIIQGHIEDLRLVNERVKKSEKTLFYQEANQSLNNSL